MTKFTRIKEIIFGIVTIACALLTMVAPSDGYDVIILILAVWLMIRGIRTLVYYFSMARFMVGGRSQLYSGVILLDFGILTATLTDVPHYYVLLYLIMMHAFSGLIEVLRALEAKRYGAPSWRLKLSHGILNLLVTVASLIFMKYLATAVIVYGIGLIYSSVMRIISACRKTKLVYIQ